MLNVSGAVYLKLHYRQAEIYSIPIQLRGHKTIASH